MGAQSGVKRQVASRHTTAISQARAPALALYIHVKRVILAYPSH